MELLHVLILHCALIMRCTALKCVYAEKDENFMLTDCMPDQTACCSVKLIGVRYAPLSSLKLSANVSDIVNGGFIKACCTNGECAKAEQGASQNNMDVSCYECYTDGCNEEHNVAVPEMPQSRMLPTTEKPTEVPCPPTKAPNRKGAVQGHKSRHHSRASSTYSVAVGLGLFLAAFAVVM